MAEEIARLQAANTELAADFETQQAAVQKMVSSTSLLLNERFCCRFLIRLSKKLPYFKNRKLNT